MLFATLHHHLQQHNTPLPRSIQDNLYVDNIASGCKTEQQAIQYLQESRPLLSSAGFKFRAWTSNCDALNKRAQEGGIASDSQPVNVLGLLWNTRTDQLSLMTDDKSEYHFKPTSDHQAWGIKDTCKLFDPLGIASPVAVRAKIFLQTLWQLRADWDQPLDTGLQDKWNTILSDLQQLSALSMKRRYFQAFIREGKQLHVFADASMKDEGVWYSSLPNQWK